MDDWTLLWGQFLADRLPCVRPVAQEALKLLHFIRIWFLEEAGTITRGTDYHANERERIKLTHENAKVPEELQKIPLGDLLI